jgi:hypothetical protein
MSTAPKKVVRPVKPKTKQPVQPVAEVVPVVVAEVAVEVVPDAATAEVVEVTKTVTSETTETTETTTEVSEVVAESTEPVAEPVAETADAQHKQSKSEKAAVFISAARVRRHIDKLNLNSALDIMTHELKVSINSYKAAAADVEAGKLTGDALTAAKDLMAATDIDTLERKMVALSRERIRFSNEAAVVLAIICDEMVQQLAGAAMNHILATKKKIIYVQHLHEAGVEKLSLYPLFKTLPSFSAQAVAIAKATADDQRATALKEALTQGEKDFKKKYNVRVARKKVDPDAAKSEVKPEAVAEVAAEAEKPEAKEEDEDSDSDSKTSFKFYVDKVCKELVRREPKYSAIRVSTKIKVYLSDLVVEFIQRISPLVHLTAHLMKNKTINDIAILKTVEALLLDGHTGVETIELKECEVVDAEKLKAEQTKQAEEKKEGREYKFNVDDLPKVSGFTAVRTLTYPTAKFNDLNAVVQQKLKLF